MDIIGGHHPWISMDKSEHIFWFPKKTSHNSGFCWKEDWKGVLTRSMLRRDRLIFVEGVCFELTSSWSPACVEERSPACVEESSWSGLLFSHHRGFSSYRGFSLQDFLYIGASLLTSSGILFTYGLLFTSGLLFFSHYAIIYVYIYICVRNASSGLPRFAAAFKMAARAISNATLPQILESKRGPPF